MSIRSVRKVVTGRPAVDGDGVKLVRVIGQNDTKDFDPFLMMDAFDSSNPADYSKGFPWHPHRGIETITYLLRGNIEHGDSLGNKGSILDGECQWMTAGSGIIHQEMPKPSERMLGVQLWLNLPANKKMVSPKYHGIAKSQMPVVQDENARVYIIGGSYQGTTGALEGEYVKPLILDVKLDPGALWSLETDKEATVFVYIVQGEGAFDPSSGELVSEKHALLFTEGDKLQVKASERGVQFLLMSGKPLKEPIAWGGPIVMNTREELQQAFKELDENTFIKHEIT